MKQGAIGAGAAGVMRAGQARVFPVKPGGVVLPAVLLVVLLLAFAFMMMRLEVQRGQYTQRIQAQQERVEQLRGDVARLNSALATHTSLLQIRQRALELGMVEPAPDAQPRDLTVVLYPDELARARAQSDGSWLGHLLANDPRVLDGDGRAR